MHRLVRAAALLLFAFSSVALAAVSTSEEAIRIQRDEYGVPHVFATTTFGLYYGVGYAAAEDKLYPLEILRRTALGRVSEVLGANFAATDEAARRRIELADLVRQFRALKPKDQDIFLGFAAGFSARVARKTQNPP